ncbi:MAG TPA: metal-dependent hydrolase [Gemmataceae bacterium]|nr:metal-dependent hydrolase [Gemmataceae bacterium]
MASYRGHLAFSSLLGGAYAGLAAWHWQMDWGPVLLGAGFTTLGGLLPDLDSDSSLPVREVFGLAAAATPVLLVRRVLSHGFTTEQTLVLLSGVYLLVRYGARALLGRLTVHRGMFHSIPAMLIAGLLVLIVYQGPALPIRLYLAGGVMLGYLSHLVLDELCSVDLLGTRPRLKKHAGSPLKLFSSSWPATLLTYGLLAWLVYLVHLEFDQAATGRRETFWSVFFGRN